jgi:hypothetical protein
METVSISLINRFHNIVDQDLVAVIEIKNYIFPTLRSCSRTYIRSFDGFYSYTTIRFGIPNTYEGNASFYVSFEGVSEDENVIKRLFDQLPNFFSSFEEESPEH